MTQAIRIPGTVSVRGTAKANEMAIADLAADDPPKQATAALARRLEGGGENVVHIPGTGSTRDHSEDRR